MNVWCLAQERSTKTPAGLEPGPLDPARCSAQTIRPLLRALTDNLQGNGHEARKNSLFYGFVGFFPHGTGTIVDF